ncbi:hypothetical protein ISN45_Aa08g022100 [Arabidopsis thaliana x Arabidopsis arenosa]|uniref:AT3G52170-like helix-turn-helix domain-containing protein n=1 Tax=Arabidopsis thaliana x Arabidopsis arenosa TaxID=1240361 RepID=A0A8T1XK78_9BRAS|nr:hypothetical protein ISN45_Aa08g022100 [Arabidopsis thaliana x Arabidopsis arenosa]
MILKQLKQFTLSATRRNVDVKRLARFYGSPAVCESLTTSKVSKRLSRDDRRALVESFVNEYRATNAGRFPSLDATRKQVGGNYYIVRDIFQELKLKPKAHVPIVAKALSEVSPSVPGDASSHFSPAPVPIVAKPLSEVPPSVPDDASTHFSPAPVPIVAKPLSEVPPSVPDDASTHFSPAPVPIVAKPLSEVPPSVPDYPSSDFSPVVVEPEFQAGMDTTETGSEQRQDIIDTSHSNSDDESNLQGNNLIITATDDRRETETTQGIEVEVYLKNSETEEEGNLTHLGNQESKADHLEGAAATEEKGETDTTQGIEVEVCLKNSETEKEGNLTHLGNLESKADHLEGAAVSADVVPTETRQVSETGAGEVKETEAGEVKERSSAWSNIMSFAKEFTNFWRKM